MTVNIFPGGLRIGVLDTRKSGVEDPAQTTVDPKFQILVLLKGYHLFSFDGIEVELDARAAPDAVMMRVEKSCTLRHLQSFGDPYRKISIATSLDWVDQIAGAEDLDWPDDTAGASPAFRLHNWVPCTEITRLASQIVAPPPQESDAQVRLYRMSRGMELVRRALAQELVETSYQRHGDDATAERIRLFLLDHLSEDLPLDRLEQEFGLNRRSLQRHFKSCYGLTLRDFIRRERLLRARRALSEDGVPIAEAAFIAGYSSTENFATAFRVYFGLAPHDVQNRVI